MFIKKIYYYLFTAILSLLSLSAEAFSTYECKSYVELNGEPLGISLKTETILNKTERSLDGETQIPYGTTTVEIKNKTFNSQYKLEIQLREIGTNNGETLCDAFLVNQNGKVVAASRTDRSKGGIQDQNISILNEFENTETINAKRSGETIKQGTPTLITEVHCWKNN